MKLLNHVCDIFESASSVAETHQAGLKRPRKLQRRSRTSKIYPDRSAVRSHVFFSSRRYLDAVRMLIICWQSSVPRACSAQVPPSPRSESHWQEWSCQAATFKIGPIEPSISARGSAPSVVIKPMPIMAIGAVEVPSGPTEVKRLNMGRIFVFSTARLKFHKRRPRQEGLLLQIFNIWGTTFLARRIAGNWSCLWVVN